MCKPMYVRVHIHVYTCERTLRRVHVHMCLSTFKCTCIGIFIWTLTCVSGLRSLSLSLCPLCSSNPLFLHLPSGLQEGPAAPWGAESSVTSKEGGCPGKCARIHSFSHIHSLIHTLTQFHTHTCPHTQTLTLTFLYTSTSTQPYAHTFQTHSHTRTLLHSHTSHTLTVIHFNIQSHSHILRHAQVLTPTQP